MAVTHLTAGTALPPDTRHCGYHHRPTALCELLATCPNGGLVAVPGPDGDVDLSACLCPVCVAAVAA